MTIRPHLQLNMLKEQVTAQMMRVDSLEDATLVSTESLLRRDIPRST